MKVKYRNEILNPNRSKYCINCALYKYARLNGTCFGLCHKTYVFGGFDVADDCEVLEL